jgi:monofunctional biosynthetic peptidoglycan transglycosylase
MAAKFSFKNFTFKKFLWKSIKLVFWAHIALITIIGLMSIYMIWFNPPTGTLIVYRAGFNFSNVKKPSALKMEEIPEIFIHDLLNAEDGRFREHYGFDIKSIQRARELNKEAGHRAYGGSTITQQLARTLFLMPNKTYFRKYLELIIAVEIDLILSKNRILELYLTYAELGDKVYGVQDASQHYYKRNFSKISADQRIRLLVILASPIKHGPYSFNSNPLLRKRYKNIRKWH